MIEFEKPNGTVISVSDNQANRDFAEANGWKVKKPKAKKA